MNNINYLSDRFKIKRSSYRTLTIVWIFALLNTSCNQKDDTLTFDRNDFKSHRYIKSDTIDFQGVLNPSSFHILRDSLILSIDKKSSEGHFIYVHNLKNGELLATAGSKGLGPGELLSCRVQLSGEQENIYVFDYLTQKYSKWSIDSLLKNGIHYKPDVHKLNSDVEQIFFIDDSLVLGYNTLFIENEEYSNGLQEIHKIQLPISENFKLSDGNEKYFPSNVNGAFIFASKEKNRIVLADFYKDQLKILDYTNLEIIDQKTGPDLILPDYYSKDGRAISFMPGLYYRAYYPSIQTREHIYLLYTGIKPKKSGMAPIDSKPVEIFKIDWDGNLLSRFTTNTFLTNISINQNETTLYGTTWDNEGNPPKLVQFEIN